MARPREFDEETALDQAMRLFWTQGYQGTSLHDLLQTMGISKSSFYETFRSKRDLFMRSLEHFDQTQALHAVAKLDAGVPARTAVAEIFALLIDRAVNQAGHMKFRLGAVHGIGSLCLAQLRRDKGCQDRESEAQRGSAAEDLWRAFERHALIIKKLA